MRLQVLGCSGGIGPGARTTSFLLDGDILIDAGTGLCDLGWDALRGIRHIFLTHSHMDHVFGIPLLADALFSELDEPLTVHALPQTIEAIGDHIFNWSLWPDFRQLPEPRCSVLRFAPQEPGEVRAIGERSVTLAEVRHAVPAAGFMVADADGARFCFSGDTGENDTLWPLLNRQERLDLLVIECAFPDELAALARSAGHYTPTSLVADLGRLELDTEVAITHIKPGSEERIMEQLHEAAPDRHFHQLRAGEVFTL